MRNIIRAFILTICFIFFNSCAESQPTKVTKYTVTKIITNSKLLSTYYVDINNHMNGVTYMVFVDSIGKFEVGEELKFSTNRIIKDTIK